MNFELFLLYQNPGECSNHNRCFLREFRWILHGFNTNPKGKAARGAGVPWKKRGEKGPKKEKKKFFHFPLDFFGNIRYNNQAPYGEVF
ncbi:MAG: hypothetical protein ACLRS7_08425 [Acutalibacter sp.]